MSSKPSPAQAKMLERMATGGEVWTLISVNSYAFWHGNNGTANMNTVMSLRSRGWIKDYDRDWRGGKYRITDAGRAAFAGDNR